MQKPISDCRIYILHIGMIAAAAFLDLPTGIHVPGAEHVIEAGVVNAHATLRESKARRTDAIDRKIQREGESIGASHQ